MQHPLHSVNEEMQMALPGAADGRSGQMNVDAMQIRIQLAANLLEGLAPRLEGWKLNVMHREADDEDADQMRDQLALVRAALDILRGGRSDIPAELLGSTISDNASAILNEDRLR